MKSIILKQIQSRLARSNNDPTTIIKEGYLEKKSDKNFTWALRFCVMDQREFRYYYQEKDAIQKREPLCTIMLKHIYAILPLNEGEKVNKNWAFQLNISAWYKK